MDYCFLGFIGSAGVSCSLIIVKIASFHFFLDDFFFFSFLNMKSTAEQTFGMKNKFFLIQLVRKLIIIGIFAGSPACVKMGMVF